MNGSRLKQRPEDKTIASVSSTSLGLLKSHQTLPKIENKIVEADQVTQKTTMREENKQLMEMVRKQQQEIDQLKSRLDSITVSSAKINDYGQVSSVNN